jgi:hypothetical protein
MMLLGFMLRCKIVAGGASERAGAAAATRWNGTGAASTAEAAGAGRAGVAGTGREAEGLVPVPELVRSKKVDSYEWRLSMAFDDFRTAALERVELMRTGLEGVESSSPRRRVSSWK